MPRAAFEVLLLPLGDVPPEPLDAMEDGLRAVLPVRMSRAPPVTLPDSAFLEARRQYDSTRLMQLLADKAPAEPGRILGVCDVDLCTPILTFVFGAAEVDGRCAVVSLHRLWPEAYGLPHDPALFLQRCAKEAVHEIGHTKGLRHCQRWDCVMHSSNGIEETDLKREIFCPACRKKLLEIGIR